MLTYDFVSQMAVRCWPLLCLNSKRDTRCFMSFRGPSADGLVPAYLQFKWYIYRAGVKTDEVYATISRCYDSDKVQLVSYSEKSRQPKITSPSWFVTP